MNAVEERYYPELSVLRESKRLTNLEFLQKFQNKNTLLRDKLGERTAEFISSYVDVDAPDSFLSSTATQFNIDCLMDGSLGSLINIKRMNDINGINRFLAATNKKLKNSGILVGCAETKGMRKKRLMNKFPAPLNIIYYIIDFILKRVFPKLKPTRKIYFLITGGRNRVLSKTEILGRLYYSGYEIIDQQEIDYLFYFIARKKKQPVSDKSPCYGPLIRLKRIGKDGKLINVYKLRTMHPYSEYLQEYIYKKNDLDTGGKFKDDFRVTTLGKIMRKYWIDELPMFVNILKGDMKLVGVRPLSKQYYNLYPNEVKKLRVTVKPGLFPPFYADMPDSLDQITYSESKYISYYQKYPVKTDIVYFFISLYNILIKRKCSK